MKLSSTITIPDPTVVAARAFLFRVGDMLAEKNARYGDSAANPLRIFSRADREEQIKVRIDDKLSRLARGSGAENEDVLLDLVGYLALLVAVRGFPTEDSARRPPQIPTGPEVDAMVRDAYAHGEAAELARFAGLGPGPGRVDTEFMCPKCWERGKAVAP